MMDEKRLRLEYEKINGEEFFGMTYDEFVKVQREGLMQFIRENNDFREHFGIVLKENDEE